MCCLTSKIVIECTDVQRFVNLPVTPLVVLHVEVLVYLRCERLSTDAVACVKE